MMNQRKRIGAYLPIFLAFLLATVTIRCIALLRDFDFNSGYFSEKVLIGVSDYMLIGVCILFFTYIFIGQRNMKVRVELGSPLGYVASAVLACATLFLGVSMLINLSERGLTLQASSLLSQPLAIVEILLFIFSVFTVAYLAATALNSARLSSGRAGLGLCAVIFFALYATYLYFEASLPINAPNKLVDQMAYLFASLFMLFETRISLDRQTPRAYVALGLTAASIAAYSAIPSIIVYVLSGKSVSNSVYDITLALAFCVYVTLRLLSFNSAKTDAESSIVVAIRDSAAHTESILNAKEEEQKLEYIRLLNRVAKKEHEQLVAEAIKRRELLFPEYDDTDEDEITVEIVEYADEDGESVGETADEVKNGEQDTESCDETPDA